MVALEDINDGATVGNDVAIEAPLATKLILKQELIGAGGLAVYAVVRAHDGVGLGFSHCGPESRQVSVDLVMLAHRDVGIVASRC